jgi:hypothetical protein
VPDATYFQALYASVSAEPDTSPTTALVTLERDVFPGFGAQPEKLETDPRSYLHEVDDQRGAQTISLLRQLGYLRPPDPAAKPGEADRISGPEIAQAWDAWTSDYRTNRALLDSNPAKVGIATEIDHDAPEPDRLRRALKACVSFEGEVTLNNWPPSTTGLAARVLAHRLHFYGLPHASPNAPSPPPALPPDELRRQLVVQLAWLDTTMDALGFVKLMGDATRMGAAVAKALRDRAIVLGVPAGPPVPDPQVDPQPMHGPHAQRAPGFYHRLLGKRIEPLDTTDFTQFIQNQIAIKVLQIRLWTLGYYPGAIDGQWGELSTQALTNFIADDPDDPATITLLGNTHDGFSTLVASPVLDAIALHADVATEALKRADLDASLQALHEAAARHEAAGGGLASKVDSLAFDAWDKLKSLADVQKKTLASAQPQPGRYEGDTYVQTIAANPDRQTNHGWRGIFTAFGRVLTNVVNGAATVIKQVGTWLSNFANGIIRAVNQAIATGLGYAHQILAYVKDSARVAVRVAGLAVARLKAWLGGTPIVTQDGSRVVATRWQMDFDTVLLVSADAPPELVTQHVRTLDWMGRSFSMLVRVGLALLKLLLALGNWLLFAWRAIALIREIFKDAHDPLFAELLAETATV